MHWSDKVLLTIFVGLQVISMVLEVTFIVFLCTYLHIGNVWMVIASIGWFFFTLTIMKKHYQRFKTNVVIRRGWIEHDKRPV